MKKWSFAKRFSSRKSSRTIFLSRQSWVFDVCCDDMERSWEKRHDLVRHRFESVYRCSLLGYDHHMTPSW